MRLAGLEQNLGKAEELIDVLASEKDGLAAQMESMDGQIAKLKE